MSIHKLGRITAIIGAVATAIFLVVGFGLMILGDPRAKIFLGLIPVGFLGLFAGVVTAFLADEKKTRRQMD